MFLHGSRLLRFSILRRMLPLEGQYGAMSSIKQSSNVPSFQDAGELWLLAHD